MPPFVAFCAFTILFLLGLLMLHWREKDEMEVEAAKQERQAARISTYSRAGKGVSMLRRLRFAIPLAVCAISAVLLFAAPAGAQQLVDAGQEGDGSGGLAFVLFTVMVFICGGAMFYMDHVRRSRLRQDEDSSSH